MVSICFEPCQSLISQNQIGFPIISQQYLFCDDIILTWPVRELTQNTLFHFFFFKTPFFARSLLFFLNVLQKDWEFNNNYVQF